LSFCRFKVLINTDEAGVIRLNVTINTQIMNELNLSILKYYKEGGELCGFEPDSPERNLVLNKFLDDDLELTKKGIDFIRDYPDWDKITSYQNRTKITIKPILSNSPYTPEQLQGKFIACSVLLDPPGLGAVIHARGPYCDMPVLYNSIDDAKSDQYFDPEWDEVLTAEEYFKRVNSQNNKATKP